MKNISLDFIKREIYLLLEDLESKEYEFERTQWFIKYTIYKAWKAEDYNKFKERLRLLFKSLEDSK